MEVRLRHNQTGHYYNGNCEWVTAQADAAIFGSIEQALQIVAEDKLDGMSIVLRHETEGAEQVFDLTRNEPDLENRAAEPHAPARQGQQPD